MKSASNLKLIIPALLFVGVVSMNFIMQDAWNVPAEAAKMANPVEFDDEGLSIAKELYKKHCTSCHGKEGFGDGVKAAELATPSGDFSEDEFQSQTDGSIYYKITEGRGDMPMYKEKIDYEEDLKHVRTDYTAAAFVRPCPHVLIQFVYSMLDALGTSLLCPSYIFRNFGIIYKTKGKCTEI